MVGRSNNLVRRPDLKPGEQITKELPPRHDGQVFTANCAKLFGRLKTESYHQYVIVSTLAATGARISEVLQIEGKDIASNGSVLIRAKKKGKNFWYYSGETAPYFTARAGTEGKIWPGFNRKGIWQLLVDAGIYMQLPGRKVKSVTHAFRHSKAMHMREVTKEKEDIATGLNHRSQKSQDHYGK